MKIDHQGELLFLEDGNIGLTQKGCEKLAKLLIENKEEREKLSFLLRSRAALIEKTNGEIWSEE